MRRMITVMRMIKIQRSRILRKMKMTMMMIYHSCRARINGKRRRKMKHQKSKRPPKG